MYRLYLALLTHLACFAISTAQDTIMVASPVLPKVSGYHAGVVQIIFSYNNGETVYFDRTSVYSLGFPFGITFNTKGKSKIDLELVPFINPYIYSDRPFKIHLLYHPGILYPLKYGWTLGLRAAFEIGEGQFGFTPLVNKAFNFKNGNVFFIELVAPGRFGPNKDSGYTQLGGIHVGIGF
ncbi:MAG: hypothetical protein IPL55_16685 [Saprospiraceae bacterium]|jgi:hypothetical protein|nr:hypothetical protein [Saprospiraceae bacterium]MBL0023709.1 hypothetical protein [Saprospiraceae bacterium]